MKISLERLLGANSRLLVRRQRSYVIDIVTPDSAQFSDHGVNTTVDVIDQWSLTLGRTCLSCMTAR